MNKCPVDHSDFTKLNPMKDLLRKDLPPLTPRIARLPIDPERGYPVPWFVTWIDGKPEFRLADSAKWVRAVREKLCWVCGEPMGVHMAFVIGPMCSVNRISADPPAHLDCAQWSVRGCPFLVRPNMVRREDELTERNEVNGAGIMIKRNPGVMLVWVTRSYMLVPDHAGRHLFKLGEPEACMWWREGRRATRAEILEAIESGLPILRGMDPGDPEAEKALQAAVDRAMKLVPNE